MFKDPNKKVTPIKEISKKEKIIKKTEEVEQLEQIVEDSIIEMEKICIEEPLSEVGKLEIKNCLLDIKNLIIELKKQDYDSSIDVLRETHFIKKWISKYTIGVLGLCFLTGMFVGGVVMENKATLSKFIPSFFNVAKILKG